MLKKQKHVVMRNFGSTTKMSLSIPTYASPRVTLTSEGGASCEIGVWGAHVLSWKDATGTDLLYMSSGAKFEAGKTALRGGIPICWPAFNTKKPSVGKHGFVRTATHDEWKVETSSASSATLTFRTTFGRCIGDGTGPDDGGGRSTSSEEAVSTHTAPVDLSVDFLLTDTALALQLRVKNGHGSAALPFSGALHTYFAKGADQKLVVRGFKDRYEYTRELGKEWKNEDDEVAVSGDMEVERMFYVPSVIDDGHSVPDPSPSTLSDLIFTSAYSKEPATSFAATSNRPTPAKLHLYQSKSLPDTVVWNIGKNVPEKIPKDLDDPAAYICVEPGIIEAEASVLPGKTWVGWHVMQCVQDAGS
ncbi:unnamed protein product [Amoebophrya sp. A25]|nr:unnamed protein product [Amoebophrya sp. A25]|eukprot:GSA25T00015053001.1